MYKTPLFLHMYRPMAFEQLFLERRRGNQSIESGVDLREALLKKSRFKEALAHHFGLKFPPPPHPSTNKKKSDFFEHSCSFRRASMVAPLGLKHPR